MAKQLDNSQNIHKEVEQYLKYLRVELKYPIKTTIAQYSSTLYKFLEVTEWGNIKSCRTMTQDTIRTYLHYLDSKEVANTTYNKHLSVLRSFFDWGLNIEEIFTKNPSLRFRIRKTHAEEVIPFSDEDITTLLDTSTNLNNFMIFGTYMSLGCRVSELCNLQLENVIWAKKYIQIKNAKGGKSRNCVVLQSYLDWLLFYINTYRADKLREYGLNNNNYPYVFIGLRGTQMVAENINHMIKSVCSKNNIDTGARMSNHIFRHTFITNYLNNGGDSKCAEIQVGHSSVGTTRAIYFHKSLEDRLADLKGRVIDLDNHGKQFNKPEKERKW